MKKTRPHFLKSKKQRNSEIKIQTEKIYLDLEIPQRTQIPPSEELIAKLNQIASQPPFSYTQKKKDNNLL
ncbi:MAG TPA: hypothetical protein VGO21_00445 [Candidatus Paceibacterota bacterium]|jgi:hypothetical protein|nr:hypothetical protein [Candidatus Paceibacterota bacterium]